MPYSNMALDADRKNGPAARSFAADAHDCIMVRIKRPYRIQVCGTKMRPQWRAPLGFSKIDRHRQTLKLCSKKAPVAVHHRSACSGVKALRNTSHARRQAAKLCYRFGPLTPSARSANPDRRRRDEERRSSSEQRTGKNQKPPLDRKSPIQVRIHLPPARSQQRTLWLPGASHAGGTQRSYGAGGETSYQGVKR
jgi:hypothetical protein